MRRRTCKIKHLAFGFLALTGSLAVGSAALGAISDYFRVCGYYPWEITSCGVKTVYEDGSIETSSFIPERDRKLMARTCYKFGCDPRYCSDWRQDIRSKCKSEYARLKQIARSIYGEKKRTPVIHEEFEGCATLPRSELTAKSGAGAFAPLDWLVRKVAPASLYAACTTETEDEETAKLTMLERKIASAHKAVGEAAGRGLAWTREQVRPAFNAINAYIRSQMSRLASNSAAESTAPLSAPGVVYEGVSR
jgi:hypothetical protein